MSTLTRLALNRKTEQGDHFFPLASVRDYNENVWVSKVQFASQTGASKPKTLFQMFSQKRSSRDATTNVAPSYFQRKIEEK